MKVKHFDTWFVKLVAVIAIAAAMAWMAYAVRDHYHAQHVCKCVLAWEYVPFVVSGLFIVFFATILSRVATTAAAGVVLPFIDRLRLGRETTSSTVIPAQPATPATVVTTTTHPLPDAHSPDDDKDAPK